MNKRATERDLNANQFEQLKTAYVNTIVDSMSNKDLYQYVLNDMDNFVDKLTQTELIEEIKYTLDDEMLDGFITEIKGQSEGKNLVSYVILRAERFVSR